MPEAVKHWSMTTLRDRLVKIGAKIVRHGRSVIFQTAEVMVPQALFAEISDADRPVAGASARMKGEMSPINRCPAGEPCPFNVLGAGGRDQQRRKQTLLGGDPGPGFAKAVDRGAVVSKKLRGSWAHMGNVG